MEFALPEDIERLRHSRKKDLGLSEKLELGDEPVAAGVNFIELAWRWVVDCLHACILACIAVGF